MTSLNPASAAAQPLPRQLDEPTTLGLTTTAWIKIGIVTLLFVLLFWSNFWRLWSKTNPFSTAADANWQHAFAIPLIGLYYLYANRQQLLSAPVRPGWSGGIIMLLGILLFGYAIWPGRNDYAKDLGMVITLFGVVALLAGWQVMKIAWFPIIFLICGIPWTGLFYSLVSGPLQHLAASVAVLGLRACGVDAENTGVKIITANRVLSVAEACSGLKALMTFITVAAAVAFLSARPLWQKLIVVASAIPIAIFCNVMRVTGQGILDHYWSPEVSEGFAHQFVGLVMLIPAFFLILLVCWVLDRLFLDEVEDKDQPKRPVISRTPSIVGGAGLTPSVATAGAGAVSRPQVQPSVTPARPATAPQRPAAAARPASDPRPAGAQRPVEKPQAIKPSQATGRFTGPMPPKGSQPPRAQPPAKAPPPKNPPPPSTGKEGA